VYLSFDPFMKGLLSPSWGLVKELAEESDDEATARLAYLSVLNRGPTADETKTVCEHLKSAKDRKTGCQDLTWALIASAAFRFNH